MSGSIRTGLGGDDPQPNASMAHASRLRGARDDAEGCRKVRREATVKTAGGGRGLIAAIIGVVGVSVPAVASAAPAAPEVTTATTATTVTAAPSASVAVTDTRVLVRGSASGGAREVRLERLVGRTWRTIDTAVASADGSFALTLHTGTPGVSRYRVHAPASGTDGAGTSRAFTVGVGDGDPRAVSYLTTPAVRWDPCTPIGYRVNLSGAPDGALDDVRRAVSQVSVATGVNFRYLGTTTVVPGSTSTDVPDAYPADTRLVVAYTTPAKSKYFGRGTDLLGVGGVFYDLTPVKVGRSSWHRALQGYVVLDSGRDLPGGFGAGSPEGLLGTWGQVLLHELGHSVGLDHPPTADKAQIMYPETTYKQARWGAGDLVGLRRLGAASGCFPAAKDAQGSAARNRVDPSLALPAHPSGTVARTRVTEKPRGR